MKLLFRKYFIKTVSALAYTSIEASQMLFAGKTKNNVVEFILRQHSKMPDFLKLPMIMLTLAFDVYGLIIFGKLFHRQHPSNRLAQYMIWKSSPLGICRDFIRFFDSLSVLGWTTASNFEQTPTKIPWMSTISKTYSKNFYQVAIIGSGPGGAITAAVLAEKGVNVVLLEEGGALPLESCHPFSVEEMVQKYRNGGLTPALGRPKVPYVEGRTLGGGSEINSGLYHRTPTSIIEFWRQAYDLNITEAEMKPYFEACEKDINVSLSPVALPLASLKLQEGADKLGWRAQEVPRWFAYDTTIKSGNQTGKRQSMTQTFLKRYVNAEGTLLCNSRVQKFISRKSGFRIKLADSDLTRNDFIDCEKLFISCGAIGTPALLQRSGIQGNFGKGLQMHPTIKVVAEFDEEVNSETMGVPAHQVKEFAPAYSFGCSISSVPYLALALLDHQKELSQLNSKWKRMAVYYAMIVPNAQGTVRSLPGYSDPLVRFQLTDSDLNLLATALRGLCELLFAAGAVKLMPSIAGFGSLEKPDELSRIPSRLSTKLSNLMTIHLFSTCRMGENANLCPVDSFGQVRGFKGLHIADSSLLPSAPGVNPQGSLMAFARRNATHFIETNILN